LQLALWLFRGFVLEEEGWFSVLVLSMFLWYHCLNAMFGGAERLERTSRFWAKCWLLLTAASLVVPPAFGCDGWPLQQTLLSLLLATPCMVLYWLPVAPSHFTSASTDNPSQSW